MKYNQASYNCEVVEEETLMVLEEEAGIRTPGSLVAAQQERR